MRTEKWIVSAINRLRAMGAEQACVLVEETEKHICSVYSHARTADQHSLSETISITLQVGGRRATRSDFCSSEQDVLALAEMTYADLQYTTLVGCSELPALCFSEVYSNCAQYKDGILRDRLEELLRSTALQFPSICYRACNLSHQRTQRHFFDLLGKRAEECYEFYCLDAAFSAIGEERSTSFQGYTQRMRDLNSPLIELADLRVLLEQTANQLLPLGEKPIGNTLILAPNVMGILTYQILMRQLSDAAVTGGTSRWAKKFGGQVASSMLTIRIAPDSEYIIGEPRLTELGAPVENCTLIQEGVLKGTLLSETVAEQCHLPKGPSNLSGIVLEPGEKRLEEMINDVDSGLLVCRLSGGIPNLNGDISGVAKTSFLIQQGRIKAPCEGVSIAGNLLEMLSDIDDISRETMSLGDMVMPYLKTTKLHIS